MICPECGSDKVFEPNDANIVGLWYCVDCNTFWLMLKERTE